MFWNLAPRAKEAVGAGSASRQPGRTTIWTHQWLILGSRTGGDRSVRALSSRDTSTRLEARGRGGGESVREVAWQTEDGAKRRRSRALNSATERSAGGREQPRYQISLPSQPPATGRLRILLSPDCHHLVLMFKKCASTPAHIHVRPCWTDMGPDRFQPSADVSGQVAVKSSVQRSIRNNILAQWRISPETFEQIWPKKESLTLVKWSVSSALRSSACPRRLPAS